MATSATLTANLREETGKGAARRLRAAGRIPAVIYGHGEETQKLSLDAHELGVLFQHISVENTIIELTIERTGKGKKAAQPIRALVREVQTHPYRAHVLHVDFYQLHAGEKVDVEVPIRVTGTAAGVKLGGVLQQTMHEVAILCLPEDIPEAITVDVSALDIGDSIHIGDLVIPEGVQVEVEADRTVCSVIAPTVAKVEEEEAEAEAAVEGEEPEIVGRAAEDEEAGEGAEG
ncbi:MAG: 50S ribosomal protein L25/general stress protein Ctc [Longimicrobiales bacterium]